ncbi:transcription factor RFX4-like [Xenia sp. Carnegie-2017]|uniref:transcription factor RFX4-like n=1 Tax=Xenia sp. Carnegie-2017 TaxID=2897299 RepID=UPI001F0486F7|nr:transcription factor RFX4-like [Xenia sp. Carnegie-2017]
MQAKQGRPRNRISSMDANFSGNDDQPGNGYCYDKFVKFNNQVSRLHLFPTLTNHTVILTLDTSASSNDLCKPDSPCKQRQTLETLKWLSENYELVDGVCVPRCVLYTHYLDYCKRENFSPVSSASFGKLVRQKFPKLTTRRLGTRGQSKYHYYGISIKESSVYYHSVYSGNTSSRGSFFAERKKRNSSTFSSDKETRNTLPKFPNAADMILKDGLSVDKVDTFIVMYRTHCQRLLDSVMNANFNEVHKLLLHFWGGMPTHMAQVLQSDAVVDVIIVCDSLLYRILTDILVPSSVLDIPESFLVEIQDFAENFVVSLLSCLENVSVILRSKKLQVAKNFSRVLKRNMAFITLAQVSTSIYIQLRYPIYVKLLDPVVLRNAARPVLLSYDSMSAIMDEFRSLDMKSILTQLLFLTECESTDVGLLMMLLDEFERILVKQAPIEAYTEWLEGIFEEYVLKDTCQENHSLESLAKKSKSFLTKWAFVTSRILQEMTLNAAPNFGTFQLIVMIFEEYILLIIEREMISLIDKGLQCRISLHLKKSFTDDRADFDCIQMFGSSNNDTVENFTEKLNRKETYFQQTLGDIDREINRSWYNEDSFQKDVNFGQLQGFLPTRNTSFHPNQIHVLHRSHHSSSSEATQTRQNNTATILFSQNAQHCFQGRTCFDGDVSNENEHRLSCNTIVYNGFRASNYREELASHCTGVENSNVSQSFHRDAQGPVNHFARSYEMSEVQQNKIHYYEGQDQSHFTGVQDPPLFPSVNAVIQCHSTFDVHQPQTGESQVVDSNLINDYFKHTEFDNSEDFQTSQPAYKAFNSQRNYSLYPETFLPPISQLTSQLTTNQ